jgi:hypothetical protein
VHGLKKDKKMLKYRFWKLIRIAIAAGTLGVFLVPIAGQNKRSTDNAAIQPAATQAAASTAVIPKGCENGKMRCVTNAVRWQAAIQNANRRAKYMKNNNGKVPKP